MKRRSNIQMAQYEICKCAKKILKKRKLLKGSSIILERENGLKYNMFYNPTLIFYPEFITLIVIYRPT